MRLRSSLNSWSSGDRRRTARWGSALPVRACVLGALLAFAGASVGTAAAQEAAPRFATRLAVVDHPQQKTTVVEVTFTRAPAYFARFSDEKRRLVIDVMDADVRGVKDTFSRET